MWICAPCEKMSYNYTDQNIMLIQRNIVFFFSFAFGDRGNKLKHLLDLFLYFCISLLLKFSNASLFIVLPDK